MLRKNISMKRHASVIAFTVLSIILTGIYCRQISTGAITPSLASWIIFGVGAILSLASYFASMITMIIALRTALRERVEDSLPVVYAARAVIFVSILLILMIRAELS